MTTSAGKRLRRYCRGFLMGPPVVGASGVFHPARRPFRVLVLIVVAIASAGSYYAYAIFAALESWILQALQIDNAQFGMLFSIGSLVAIVTSIFGGILSDYFDFPIVMLFAQACTVVGMALQAISVQIGSFGLCLFARLLFTVGSETLSALQTAVISVWFFDTELSSAHGIMFSFLRLGLLLGFRTAGVAAAEWGLVYALNVGMVTCAVSMCAALLYWSMEEAGRQDAPSLFGHREQSKAEARRTGVWRALLARLLAVRHLSHMFWLGVVTAGFYYMAIYPFMAIGSRFLERQFHVTAQEGGRITSVPNICACVVSLFLGFVIDRFGGRGVLVTIGALCALPAYLLLAFSTVSPYVSAVLLGVGFALVPDAIWPALALVAGQEHLGTGTALGVSAFNIFTAIMNPVAGAMVDRLGSYTGVLCLFFAVSALSFLFSLLWNVLDFRADRRLINAPSPMYHVPDHEPPPVPPSYRSEVEFPDSDADDDDDDIDATGVAVVGAADERTPVLRPRSGAGAAGATSYRSIAVTDAP